jgi:hypothetical protein
MLLGKVQNLILNNQISKFLKEYSAIAQAGVLIIDIIKNNPYKKAYMEAIKAGKYLAELISNIDIFGGCCLNLIAFSLGTVVLLTCI